MKTKQLLMCMLVMLISLTVSSQNPFAELLNDPVFRSYFDADIQTRDQIITDDLIVNGGSICVGFDCFNGESFGFDTFRLKENNLRIHFDDTSNSGSFPSNDWRITVNDQTNGGANYFRIDDVTGGTQPFRIEAGASTNAIYVHSNGNVGLGTATPAVELQIADGDTPAVRLEQDGSIWPAHSWDVAANETNFFIRDVTGGGSLPFRIRPTAPTSSIDISSNGAVGIGTAAANGHASLDLGATDRGLILNRLTTVQRTSIPNQAGMIVFDTDLSLLYGNDGTAWAPVGLDNQTVDVFQLNVNNLELSLEDDGVATQSVDLSSFLDNTDDQNISGSGFAGNMLTIGIEGGSSEMVDLSSLDNSGTDDQNISGSNLAGNILTIGIEGGTSETVDLSPLDNSGTDDQVLNNFLLNGPILGITIENGNAVQVSLDPLLDDLEMENAAQQVQIDNLISQNAAQQAMLDDLLARLIVLEDCACMTLGVDNHDGEPDFARLLQNVPNPFDGYTTIGYYIPLHHGKATISITATSGQKIQDIPITQFGEGSIQVDESRLQAAIYFYTLYVDGKRIDTKRMVVK